MSMNSDEPLFAVTGAGKMYGSHQALDAVTWQVTEGTGGVSLVQMAVASLPCSSSLLERSSQAQAVYVWMAGISPHTVGKIYHA